MYIHYKRGVLVGFYCIVKDYDWCQINRDFTGAESCWLIPGTIDPED